MAKPVRPLELTRLTRAICHLTIIGGIVAVAVVAGACAQPAASDTRNQARLVLLYDEFREAALRGRRERAEAIYQELTAATLPADVARALGYHAALLAYDAGDWATAATRCEAAIAADPQSPWRPSLYELWGRSLEKLRRPDAALAVYLKADLPSTRLRAKELQKTPQ